MSPQSGPVGSRYALNHWEDSSTNATRSIAGPWVTTTYTATFDTQYLLPRGTPADVRAAARSISDALGPGGFILAPAHVLQTDVPTANVLALYGG